MPSAFSWTTSMPIGCSARRYPNYYAAFVIDPDGHNVEVVCHAPG